MTHPPSAVVTAIREWANTQRQPVFVLKGIKSQRSRHPRWAELTSAARKAKHNVTDGEIIAAIDAVLTEHAAAPLVMALEV